MKAADIRAKSGDELKDQLMSLHKEQFNLRLQQASGQLDPVVSQATGDLCTGGQI